MENTVYSRVQLPVSVLSEARAPSCPTPMNRDMKRRSTRPNSLRLLARLRLLLPWQACHREFGLAATPEPPDDFLVRLLLYDG